MYNYKLYNIMINESSYIARNNINTDSVDNAVYNCQPKNLPVILNYKCANKHS